MNDCPRVGILHKVFLILFMLRIVIFELLPVYISDVVFRAMVVTLLKKFDYSVVEVLIKINVDLDCCKLRVIH